MTEEQKRNKELCEKMPYLIIRNVWTDEIIEDYDYSYTHGDELPCGWKRLFLQMCKDIKQPLIDANYLDKFRFSQIKEKYNRMTCYNFGAPEKVQDIIDNYEYVSQFICQNCGKPAKYETRGWIAGYCEDCANKTKYVNKENCDVVEFEPIRKVHIWRDGNKHIKEFDCSDIWNRFYS